MSSLEHIKSLEYKKRYKEVLEQSQQMLENMSPQESLDVIKEIYEHVVTAIKSHKKKHEILEIVYYLYKKALDFHLNAIATTLLEILEPEIKDYLERNAKKKDKLSLDYAKTLYYYSKMLKTQNRQEFTEYYHATMEAYRNLGRVNYEKKKSFERGRDYITDALENFTLVIKIALTLNDPNSAIEACIYDLRALCSNRKYKEFLTHFHTFDELFHQASPEIKVSLFDQQKDLLCLCIEDLTSQKKIQSNELASFLRLYYDRMFYLKRKEEGAKNLKKWGDILFERKYIADALSFYKFSFRILSRADEALSSVKSSSIYQDIMVKLFSFIHEQISTNKFFFEEWNNIQTPFGQVLNFLTETVIEYSDLTNAETLINFYLDTDKIAKERGLNQLRFVILREAADISVKLEHQEELQRIIERLREDVEYLLQHHLKINYEHLITFLETVKRNDAFLPLAIDLLSEFAEVAIKEHDWRSGIYFYQQITRLHPPPREKWFIEKIRSIFQYLISIKNEYQKSLYREILGVGERLYEDLFFYYSRVRAVESFVEIILHFLDFLLSYSAVDQAKTYYLRGLEIITKEKLSIEKLIMYKLNYIWLLLKHHHSQEGAQLISLLLKDEEFTFFEENIPLFRKIIISIIEQYPVDKVENLIQIFKLFFEDFLQQFSSKAGLLTFCEELVKSVVHRQFFPLLEYIYRKILASNFLEDYEKLTLLNTTFPYIYKPVFEVPPNQLESFVKSFKMTLENIFGFYHRSKNYNDGLDLFLKALLHILSKKQNFFMVSSLLEYIQSFMSWSQLSASEQFEMWSPILVQLVLNGFFAETGDLLPKLFNQFSNNAQLKEQIIDEVINSLKAYLLENKLDTVEQITSFKSLTYYLITVLPSEKEKTIIADILSYMSNAFVDIHSYEDALEALSFAINILTRGGEISENISYEVIKTIFETLSIIAMQTINQSEYLHLYNRSIELLDLLVGRIEDFANYQTYIHIKIRNAILQQTYSEVLAYINLLRQHADYYTNLSTAVSVLVDVAQQMLLYDINVAKEIYNLLTTDVEHADASELKEYVIDSLLTSALRGYNLDRDFGYSFLDIGEKMISKWKNHNAALLKIKILRLMFLLRENKIDYAKHLWKELYENETFRSHKKFGSLVANVQPYFIYKLIENGLFTEAQSELTNSLDVIHDVREQRRVGEKYVAVGLFLSNRLKQQKKVNQAETVKSLIFDIMEVFGISRVAEFNDHDKKILNEDLDTTDFLF